MAELKPGKGFHSVVTQEVLEFLSGALEDILDAYGEEGDAAVDNGDAEEILRWIRGSSSGWKETKDKFGKKIHRELKWGDGEHRVTVVVKNGEVRIDIRQWYDPDA